MAEEFVPECMMEVLHFRVPTKLMAQSCGLEYASLLEEAQTWLVKALRRFGATTDTLDPETRQKCSAVTVTEDACPFAVESLEEGLRTLCPYLYSVECDVVAPDEALDRFHTLVEEWCGSIRFHNGACAFICDFMRMGDEEREPWLLCADQLFRVKHATSYEILLDFIQVHAGRKTMEELMSSRRLWLRLFLVAHSV